ncbi:PolC-type DNA polymerase III [Peptostreptococcus canis]|uniref:DNA polymerase III PolC-type n=1 Tax=Peptostreptococcus canis TaxID=1159213 RepID=A0ABR6TL46_9FIRM|nr:PolC-type DNA polymerase III [Peptostreptococcus canis]MBC2575868.1 PolC-type DNA polymerase III [Peptostreptococcus canis]MBP1998012.1 DNA polymerase-3 subunit alpha (Gram-positive type) [Peptostreptococcus canis]
MDLFTDFLKSIDINDKKTLKGLEDVILSKVIVNKKNSEITLYITSKEVISNRKLDQIRRRIAHKSNVSVDIIKIRPRIKYNEKKGEKFILKKYWENIYYLIWKKCPSVAAFEKQLEYLYIDRKLKIKAPNEFIFNRFKEKSIDKWVKELIQRELGLGLEVELECAVRNMNQEESLKKIIKRQNEDVDEVLSRIDFSSKNIEEEKDKYIVNLEDPNLVYGKDIKAFHLDICDISENTGTVAIVGEVFKTDQIENRNGKISYHIYVTDNTAAICCKVKLNDQNKDKVINNTKPNSYVRIVGDVITNTYNEEREITITSIKLEKKREKIDVSSEKRVELHLHTQMSAMDSTVSIKKLFDRLQTWGHKAVAITDHGVVQAFPDAMNAAKGKDIKVIYGVEAYLVDDNQDIIQDANDKDFNQRFVVFDIETTGLSTMNDKITEIGAVLIENGKITDNFSEFVNPEMDIPYKIQELTGITNEMVSDAKTIEDVLPRFMNFVKDSVLVAHNANFDTGFILENCKKLGMEYNNKKVDTITISRVILKHMRRVTLDRVAKEMNVTLRGHHRAVNDAIATAEIFVKFIEIFKKDGAEKLSDVNRIYGKIDYTKIRPTHATIYAKNQVGLKNLYRLISDSHINHFYSVPRILKSKLIEMKEGLIVGTACSSGEIFNAVQRNLPEDEIKKMLELYDFIEIMPLENNKYLVESGELKNFDELKDINKKLIALGEKYSKLVVATGDVHMLDEHEGIFRTILMYSIRNNGRYVEPFKLHLRTTDEMLEEFKYLGKEKAYEVVVTNSNKIADVFDRILPIPDETCPPVIEGSQEELRKMCFEKAYGIYGNPLPEVVQSRLEKELNSIINNGYAVMYIIASKLVAKSLSDGYLVGSRGSVGSSLAATMSDITEVNPLPAHYICPNKKCKYSEFFAIGEWGSGVDLPDKCCPKCGEKLVKDGHDIPFEVFLGFEGDKEPDIDLNFSGTYQPTIHEYTEELFGKGHTYRAGTIGTVKDKTAFAYVKKFSEENNKDYSNAEMSWLTEGCTGVKRTSGQHPGGVMVIPDYKDVHDFTPIQYPANDTNSSVITTHFDYHSISGRILKLDILGHDGPTIIRMLEDMTGINITDIPLDDPETMSLFTSTKALGVTEEDIGTPVGSLAIPEFGTKFTRQMLIDTKPTTFAELVRISGLSHGTDVWTHNAQDLVRGNVVGLKDVISTRDDIMNYLIFSGLEPKMAFTIMESVRKGKGLKPEFEDAMKANNVPAWYINSCKKIKYMFPKAHAVAYVMTSFRIAYCKINYPEAFYATYFTTKVEDFDIELITSGIDVVKKKMESISEKGNAITAKEKNQYTVLEIVVEMYARNIEFLKVDIYKSDAKEFKIAGKGKILPPMISLDGMGENAAQSIVDNRDKPFLSKEDLIKRTKVSKSVVEKLSEHGSLDGLSEKNQLSFL